MSPAARERSTMSCTSASTRSAPVAPSDSISSAGRSDSEMIPARTASSMSWLMYATRSTIRTSLPSSVAGFSGPVWRRMPSRTCSVRFRPGPVPPLLDHLDDAQRVLVVAEAAAVPRQRLVQHLLADVPEGRMPEVVTQAHRLGQVLVQTQRPRHGARDDARLERVGEAGAVVVALRAPRTPGSCASAAGTPSSARSGRGRAGRASAPGCRARARRAAPGRSGSPDPTGTRPPRSGPGPRRLRSPRSPSPQT